MTTKQEKQAQLDNLRIRLQMAERYQYLMTVLGCGMSPTAKLASDALINDTRLQLANLSH